MGFLADKKILITGLLSKHSIAYGIAKACHREGAQLAFTYQSERFEDRIKKFAAEFGSDITIPLDVSSDEQIDNVFAEFAEADIELRFTPRLGALMDRILESRLPFSFVRIRDARR